MAAVFIEQTDDRTEVAHRAVKAAKKDLPTITALVRLFARNPKIKVKFTGGTPRTDGATVWLRVPMGYGEKRDHSPAVCGRRGADKIMLCRACAAQDDLFITMIHEVAHCIFGTFEDIPDSERQDLLRRAIDTECAGNPNSRRAQTISRRINTHVDRPENYLGLAGLVSPYLPLLINACEDVRVNLLMKEARPGTHVMFSAQTNSVFEHGIEMPDGSFSKWSDRPLNAQALIGVYCKTSDLDFSSWLDPKVVADLDDPDLSALIRRMKTARSVRSVYDMAFPLLENLRRLGYMLADDDPEDEPANSDDQGDGESESGDDTDDSQSGSGANEADDDQTQNEDGDDGQGGAADEEQGDDESDGAGTDQETQPQGEQNKPQAGSDRGDPDDDLDQFDDGGQAGAEDGDQQDDGEEQVEGDGGTEDGEGDPKPNMGDPAEVERVVMVFGRHDDKAHEDGGPEGFDVSYEQRLEDENLELDREAIEKAVNQSEHFDRPSTDLNGLRVYRFGQEPADDDEDDRYWGRSWGSADDGIEILKIDEKILAPALQQMRIAFADNRKAAHDRNRTSGRINARVLGRRVPVGDDRLFGKKTLPSKRDYFVTVGLDVSGSTQGVEIEIIKRAAMAKAELLNRLGVKFAVYAHTGGSRMVGIYEVKGPDEMWGDPQRRALSALRPSGGNYDGHSLEFYRKATERRNETDRMILYYTDGALNDIGDEFDIFTENVNICRKQNITVIGVEIGVDSGITESVGLDAIRLDRIEDVPLVVKEMQKRLR